MDNIEKKFLQESFNNGLYDKYSFVTSIVYKHSKDYKKSYNLLDFESWHRNDYYIQLFYNSLHLMSNFYGFDVVRPLYNFYQSNYHRYKRIYSRVDKILDSIDKDHKAVFLTFTFDNESLISTDIQKRSRRKLVDLLHSFSNCYVANEDFGSKKERFHYHALVLVPANFKVAEKLNTSWNFGFIKSNEIIVPDKCKLSQYVNKLVNHAKKVTNKRQCVIYSRA